MRKSSYLGNQRPVRSIPLSLAKYCFGPLSLIWSAPGLSADSAVATQQASGSSAFGAIANPIFGSPFAYGASWGSFGVGGSAVTVRSKDDPRSADGSAGLAFGVGDSAAHMGLEVDVAVSSVTTQNDSNIGEDGQVGGKLHTILRGDWALAIGAESLGEWGGLKGSQPNAYVVATKVLGFKIAGRSFPLVLNGGGGQGRFGRIDRGALSVDANRFGPFGSIGLYVAPRVSLIVDSTVNITTAAVSVVPLRSLPVTVSLGALNVAKQRGLPIDYGITMSYGFSWRQKPDC